MSDEPRCINCKATLRWERGGGEWKPNTCDSNVAIRCLNCASLLCGPCARRHFEESGLLATSRAALAASQAEVSALKERLACETESGKRCVGDDRNERDDDMSRLRADRKFFASVYAIIAASDDYTKLERFGDRVTARETLVKDVINAVDRHLAAALPGHLQGEADAGTCSVCKAVRPVCSCEPLFTRPRHCR